MMFPLTLTLTFYSLIYCTNALPIYCTNALYLCAVCTKEKLYVLDVAARVDQCAAFMVGQLWGAIEFPSPFGRDLLPEVLSLSLSHTHTLTHSLSLALTQLYALTAPVLKEFETDS